MKNVISRAALLVVVAACSKSKAPSSDALHAGDLLVQICMFVDVTVEVPLGSRLAVPDNGLLASGEHRYAFVKRGEGQLQAMEVKVGALAGDYDEVLAGLDEGEQVATQATFLLSSEAQLRGALPRWGQP